MAINPEIAAAFEQLDTAIDNLIAATNSFDSAVMLSGYTVVVTGIGFVDDPDPEDDEQNTISCNRMFQKRGQSPVLTRGMLEYAVDYMRGE